MRTLPLLRRILVTSSVLAASALVAVGCGNGDGSASERAETSTAGALRWLPAQTWMVATADLSSARIDRAVSTLGRLAAWGIVEPMLPASDGKGLRRAGLEQLAKEMSHGDVKVTAAQIEEAFGNRVGVAFTSAEDLTGVDGPDDLPLAMWVELDDEAKARDLLARAIPGKEAEHEHGGVAYYESEDEQVTYALRDDLLVATLSPKSMEQLIDVRKGDESRSLADSEDARSVLGASVDGALASAAVQTDPLLGWGADALREESDPAAARVAKALETKGVDHLVPDWMGGSVAIDGSGLRLRATWSNPHELAKPDTSARELVERLPAETTMAQATATSGDELARVQEAWAQARDAADFDLARFAKDECPKAQAALCDLGVQLALVVLEDESLADAIEEVGPTSSAFAMSAGAKGAMTTDIVSPHASVDWTRPKELADAMEAAGLEVRSTDTSATVRVEPASPLGALLKEVTADPEIGTVLRTVYGIDLAAVLSPAGLVIESRRVGDLDVVTLPVGASSNAIPALEGHADVLGDDADYRDAVKAAAPPERTGSFGYVDVRSWVGSIFDTVGGGDPDLSRAKPIVDNNLSDLPGLVWWTARQGSGDEQVGVAEVALPIRK